ncbi:MAG: acetoacetate--CoA ligase, partial [Burkholderiaceae bacterium]
MTTRASTGLHDKPLWRPDRARTDAAPITRFAAHLADRQGLAFANYESMWRWSVDELELFWSEVIAFFDVRFETPPRAVLSQRTMPGARWFEGGTLNYASQLLRRADGADAMMRPALVFRNETGVELTTSWRELADLTGSVAECLRRLGVAAGDRVVAYSPNIRETAVALLATAACGAIWSSCAPDLGATSVLDRFRQIGPKVLFAVDGYRYGGKPFDRRGLVAELVAQLPTLEAVVFIDYLEPNGQAHRVVPVRDGLRAIAWSEAIATPQPPRFEAVAFEHPLWIVYSSGTTGMPKPIIHGHGGALLEAMKGSALHLGITADDRMMWFSSTSWIMWNLWIGNLALGTTLIHYDGNPGYPDLGTLWRLAADSRATFFGTSPAFIAQCMKAGVSPRRSFDLASLRTIGSTGSPLTDEAYRWVYAEVADDLLLASISGGTDPGAAFLSAAPTLPVYAGEMQCRNLGAGIAAFDDDGKPVIGQVGELVCTTPMPSMPLGFWGDDDGARYRASYFETWPGVWRHGDWLE